ncbi:MAG: hypothetical protein WA230_00740, partial [Xanthobacteraceae bacterium]
MIVTLCIARRQFAADRGIATEQTHRVVIRSSLNQIERNHFAAGSQSVIQRLRISGRRGGKCVILELLAQ